MPENTKSFKKDFDMNDLNRNAEENPGLPQIGTPDYRANRRKQDEKTHMQQVQPFKGPTQEQKDTQGGQFDALKNTASRADAEKYFGSTGQVGRTEPPKFNAEERKNKLEEQERFNRQAFEQRNAPKKQVDPSKVVDAAKKDQEGRQVIDTDKKVESPKEEKKIETPIKNNPANIKEAESDADETTYKQFMDENMKGNLSYMLRTAGDIGAGAVGAAGEAAQGFDRAYGAMIDLAKEGLSGNPMSIGSQGLTSMASGLAGMSQAVQGLDKFEGVKGPEYYKDRDKARLAERYINGTFNNALKEAAGDKPLSQLGDEELYYVHRKMNRLLKPEWDRIKQIPQDQWTQEDKAFATAYGAIQDGVKGRADQLTGEHNDYKRALQGEYNKLNRQYKEAEKEAKQAEKVNESGKPIDQDVHRDVLEYQKNPTLAAERMKRYRGRDNPFQGDDKARFDEAVRRGDMETVKNMINSSGQATRWANTVSRLRDAMYRAGIDEKYPLNDEDLALANVLHHALRNRPPQEGKPTMIRHRDGSTEMVEFDDKGRIIDRDYIAKHPQWVRTHPHMVNWDVADEVFGVKKPVEAQKEAPIVQKPVAEPQKEPEKVVPEVKTPEKEVEQPQEEQILEEKASEMPENQDYAQENMQTWYDFYDKYMKLEPEKAKVELDREWAETQKIAGKYLDSLKKQGIDPNDLDSVRQQAVNGNKDAETYLKLWDKGSAIFLRRAENAKRLEENYPKEDNSIQQEVVNEERPQREQDARLLDENVMTINGTEPIRNIMYRAKNLDQFINLIANGRPMPTEKHNELVQLYKKYRGLA